MGGHSIETRDKISCTLRQMWKDPEERAARIGKQRSPEMRAVYSDAARNSWANPEVRAARVAGIKAARQAFEARKGKALVLVPAWVSKAGLTAEFRQVLAKRGEFAAARHCRHLKRISGAV